PATDTAQPVAAQSVPRTPASAHPARSLRHHRSAAVRTHGLRNRAPTMMVHMTEPLTAARPPVRADNVGRLPRPPEQLSRAELPIYRIGLHRLAEPDPRNVLASTDRLAPADVADIDRRLDRLDRSSPRGPWTARTLASIADQPGVSASILAAAFGLETVVFKR